MSYLRINTEIFEKNKKAAMDFYATESEQGTKEAQFDPDVVVDDLYFDKNKNTIEFMYTWNINGEDLGSFSESIPLDMEMVIEIIECYRKKLGKLKTVFEATKDEEAS